MRYEDASTTPIVEIVSLVHATLVKLGNPLPTKPNYPRELTAKYVGRINTRGAALVPVYEDMFYGLASQVAQLEKYASHGTVSAIEDGKLRAKVLGFAQRSIAITICMIDIADNGGTQTKMVDGEKVILWNAECIAFSGNRCRNRFGKTTGLAQNTSAEKDQPVGHGTSRRVQRPMEIWKNRGLIIRKGVAYWRYAIDPEAFDATLEGVEDDWS